METPSWFAGGLEQTCLEIPKGGPFKPWQGFGVWRKHFDFPGCLQLKGIV